VIAVAAVIVIAIVLLALRISGRPRPPRRVEVVRRQTDELGGTPGSTTQA
jgi:hypothetical protein